MFRIDTGAPEPTWQAKSAVVDDSQRISFTTFARADRSKRQVIEQIEGLETTQEVDDYLAAESLMIDAIFMFDNRMGEDVTEAAIFQTAILEAGNDPAPDTGAPVATTPTAQTNVLGKNF